jgi:hypothetical protein
MSVKKSRPTVDQENAGTLSQLLGEDESVPPWELVDTGRYMPRRIRGSFRGRELG